MVDMAHFSGLVAGKGYPNPCDHAHVVTSTTHKVFRSARGGIILTNRRRYYLKNLIQQFFQDIKVVL